MIPQKYGQAADNLAFTVDYFDYATGAGYKKFYLAGTKDTTSTKYILTGDSGLVSDNEACYVESGTLSFDLTFNNPAIIAAADSTVSYTVLMSSSNAGSFSIVWTVYHVTSGGTETSLGTATNTTTDGDPTAYRRRTVKIPLTTRSFAIGETLRVKAAITSNSAGQGLYIDPSGHISATDTLGGTVNSEASVNIPFKLDI